MKLKIRVYKTREITDKGLGVFYNMYSCDDSYSRDVWSKNLYDGFSSFVGDVIGAFENYNRFVDDETDNGISFRFESDELNLTFEMRPDWYEFPEEPSC